MSKKYKSPIPLPDEHARLVGLIAAHWQHLDLRIQQAVAEVMGHHLSEVRLLTQHTGLQIRLDILKAYAKPAKTQAKQVWEEFAALNDDIRDANELRNKFVHATWHFKPERPRLPFCSTVQVRQGRIVDEDEPVTKAELAAAADRIAKTIDRFVNLFTALGMLQSSPPKSREESDVSDTSGQT